MNLGTYISLLRKRSKNSVLNYPVKSFTLYELMIALSISLLLMVFVGQGVVMFMQFTKKTVDTNKYWDNIETLSRGINKALLISGEISGNSGELEFLRGDSVVFEISELKKRTVIIGSGISDTLDISGIKLDSVADNSRYDMYYWSVKKDKSTTPLIFYKRKDSELLSETKDDSDDAP